MGGAHNNLLHLTAETVPIYPINQFPKLHICLDDIQIEHAASEQHVRAMITEKELYSWQELQDEIENLIESLGEKSDDLLFRGQTDSTWKLDTTMERKLKFY